MTQEEKITRSIMGKLGRMPRKRKKVVKVHFKTFVRAEISSGNWQAYDFMNTVGMWPTNKEDESYGLINII
jgi:hypothetical protein